MSDSSGSRKASSIPEWQRNSKVEEPLDSQRSPEETPEEPSEEPSKEKEAPPPSRPALLEQASRFLQDDIREASTDRKIAFLESKGLTNEEISKLLGVSRNPTASSSSSSSSSSEPAPNLQAMADQDIPPAPQPPPPSQTQQSLPQQSAIPPIITYPEFLLHSHTHTTKPPPLITARLLLSTLYLSGGLAASLYGLSKYILAPMAETLTAARHELAETAKTDLDRMNAKLESVVSAIPAAAQQPKSKSHHLDSTKTTAAAEEANDDADSAGSSSEDEDPTELFHRDFGTQTSPRPHPLSRRSSSSSTSTSSSLPSPTTTTTTTPDALPQKHTSRLQTMHTHLSALLSSTTGTLATTDDTVKERIADLQTYLEALAYSSPSYVNASSYGMYGAGGVGGGNGNGNGKVEEDAIARVKAEIRGVKGVLLSARNFPGSANAGVGVGVGAGAGGRWAGGGSGGKVGGA
ncbi:hypothetical protein MMC16_002105 [Acarospora aff. strigata]|nr:hypothetical protein [Acarospora aff. strigata]